MKILSTLFISLLLALPVKAKGLLLTGIISSAEKQTVTAPRGARWQIQIQWMAEEGKVVAKGDQIVVFDGSSEQAQLDQNEERLETMKLKLAQTKMREALNLTQAEGAYKLAKMRVGKAKIEASVPASEVSQYDKGKYELALQRAMLNMLKAEEKLKLAKQSLQTALQKKRIDLLKVQEEITYLRKQIEKMAIYAQFSGPVKYANHPWEGKKLAAGMNVQPSWAVLDLQGMSGFHVESWVHEIDVDKLQIGQTAQLVLDAYPGKTFAGKIDFVSSQAEKKPQWSTSVYYPLLVKFDQQPDVELLPGMSVRLALQPAEVVNAD